MMSQAGSDCSYILVEHLAQQRPSSLGSIVIFSFFLENIYCYLHNALLAKSQPLEMLGSLALQMKTDTAIVTFFTMTIKINGNKTELPQHECCVCIGRATAQSSLLVWQTEICAAQQKLVFLS